MTTDHFSLFQEASRGQDRPQRVIMFADLSGSTEMKEKTAEVNWLPTIGKFLDITTEAVTSHGGQVFKYLGDGTLAVFNDDQAADAINASIRIQEMLYDENKNNSLKGCLATVAIATGPVVEYRAPGGGVDYVGSVVDRAARLCSAGAPQAIWIDTATVVCANMLKVHSVLGQALDFGPDDYLDREQKVPAKGFSEHVKYREVIWRQAPVGVKSGVLTETIEKQESADTARRQQPSFPVQQGAFTGSSAHYGAPPVTIEEGIVKRWHTDTGWGFIAPLGEGGDYYVDRRFVVGEGDLIQGGRVRFVPLPPIKEGKQPLAGCTVQEGHRVEGKIQRTFPGKTFTFVDVTDSRGNRQPLHVYVGAAAETLRTGDQIRVEITRNRKGISGQLITEGSTGAEKAVAGADWDTFDGEPV